jgi:hypothetical protein
MEETPATLCIAFAGSHCIASGELRQVAATAKESMDRGETRPILIFDAATSALIEVDFRGSAQDVQKRLAAPQGAAMPLETPAQRGRGRPKLGVVAREVTLLPRHWEWLNGQPGGASVALRKLVEEARRVHHGHDTVRRAQEAAYRFMAAMAGNETGFEQATGALFANDAERFRQLTATWPVDVRKHAMALAVRAFQHSAGG